MGGKGVLLESLKSEEVESILVITRESISLTDPKLKEMIQRDFFDLTAIEKDLQGYDACFFCIGVSSFRMKEETYRKITYELPLHFAKTLATINPEMTLCHVSATGADPSEQSKMIWERVKEKAENALRELPFKAVYIFRPAYVQPAKGVKSKTAIYNLFLPILSKLYPLIKRAFPKYSSSTRAINPLSPLSDPFKGALKRPTQKANS